MKTISFGRIAFAAGLLASSSFWSSALAQAAPRYVPGELLIQFRAGTSPTQQQNARDRVAAARLERIHLAAEGKGELERATVHGGQPLKVAIAALEADPAVEFAEPNWIYVHQEVSNDPYYTNGSLWGMYGDDQPTASGPTGTTNPFGSQAEKAWAGGNKGNKSVYVGVIDEGIDFHHGDLNANIWTNPNDPVDGIDNDKNGYVDDVHGWDFVNNDNTIYDGGTQDQHGTHVSGTIGGIGGNGDGVAGVNWNVNIISGKFLGTDGGTTANAIKAVDYFTRLKKSGVNIVATNNSWGGGGYSQSLYNSISSANNAGILFIAAAGNSGTNNDTSASYPSNYDLPNVIAVAAIDSNGALASFSQYGATTVDLGAPGVGIYSTLPNNSYASYSGTSMATPHVTGAAALYASAKSGAKAAEIKAAILNSATPTASLSGKCVTGGRLNIGALLAGLSPVAPATGSFSGVVTTNDGTTPISSAVVTAVNSAATVSFEATTGSDGRYSLGNLSPDTYTVSASATGYQSSAPVPLSATAGTNNSANFSLVRTTGAISGIVTDSASALSPISGATVNLTADGKIISATTGSDGSYSLPGTPTGTYAVTASASGYSSQTQQVNVSSGTNTSANFSLSTSPPSTMGAIYVGKIGWTPVKNGTFADLQVVVTIRRDSNSSGIANDSVNGVTDVVVANAVVNLVVALPNGSSRNFSGTTDSSGQLTITLSKAKTGTYTATVTALTLSTDNWAKNMDSGNPSTYTLSSTSGPQSVAPTAPSASES